VRRASQVAERWSGLVQQPLYPRAESVDRHGERDRRGAGWRVHSRISRDVVDGLLRHRGPDYRVADGSRAGSGFVDLGAWRRGAALEASHEGVGFEPVGPAVRSSSTSGPTSTPTRTNTIAGVTGVPAEPPRFAGHREQCGGNDRKLPFHGVRRVFSGHGWHAIGDQLCAQDEELDGLGGLAGSIRFFRFTPASRRARPSAFRGLSPHAGKGIVKGDLTPPWLPLVLAGDVRSLLVLR
jgi:hypothetical protein